MAWGVPSYISIKEGCTVEIFAEFVIMISIIDCLSLVSYANDIHSSIKKIHPLVRLGWKARAVDLYEAVRKGSSLRLRSWAEPP